MGVLLAEPLFVLAPGVLPIPLSPLLEAGVLSLPLSPSTALKEPASPELFLVAGLIPKLLLPEELLLFEATILSYLSLKVLLGLTPLPLAPAFTPLPA